MIPQSFGLIDLVAPAGQTITRVTVTPALTYGVTAWDYLIDSIAFNQLVTATTGSAAAGLPTATTLSLSPSPAAG